MAVSWISFVIIVAVFGLLIRERRWGVLFAIVLAWVFTTVAMDLYKGVVLS